MLVCYSIAKEGKYKKGDNGEYINCTLGLVVEGKDDVSETERLNKAKETKEWLSKQINVNPFFILPITKAEYEKAENDE